MSYFLSRNPRYTVIGALRGLVRLFYFASVFFWGALAALFIRTVLPISTYRRLRPEIVRRLGRILVCASNIRIRNEGTPPPPGALVVANHVSWADSFTFLSELGCRFMVNHLYGQIVGFGVVLRSVGVKFVNRMSVRAIGHAQTAMRTILESGESLMVFPEGRTSRGAGVRPFKSALLQVAVDLRRPVYWATVRYETPASWPPASVVIGWEEWPPLLTHIYRAFHAPRITCRIHYGKAPILAEDRRSLASALYEAVSSAHRSMPQLPEATLRRIDVVHKVARTIVYTPPAERGRDQESSGDRS
ncbi:MAG: 1-acyl-sn-glycerol-3-phosphate acyltransferase [Spirochaetaceae bacterium]|nr:MAG: 1-acyl-sn-glycerol-3-phosphate acyltransferase [Spirochaetaceae bacterium]